MLNQLLDHLFSKIHEKDKSREFTQKICEISTSTPATVLMYHGSGYHASKVLKGQGQFSISNPEGGVLWLVDSLEDARDFSQLWDSDDPEIYLTQVKLQNPVVIDYHGYEYDPGYVGELLRSAHKKGYDSVVFQNIRNFDYSLPVTVVGVFDGEAQIVGAGQHA